MIGNEAQRDLWIRIEALMQNTNLEEKGMREALDQSFKLAVKEVKRNSRHAAVDKVNVILFDWMEKNSMSKEVEALTNQIVGALFNLQQP